jgi:mono/diheme cytochrome c family protein
MIKMKIYFLPNLLFSVCLMAFAFESCKHEPFPTAKKPGDTASVCHPDTVYFVQKILPLLNSSCAMSGCHDNGSAVAGIILSDYQNIIASDVVRAFRPDNSKLYDRITEDDPSKLMPPPYYAALSAEQIALIYSWINQGAKNNSCELAASCDTANVKYTGNIESLLSNNCVGCHSGANASKGILLDSYIAVKNAASNPSFIGSIEHLGTFTPMPLSQAKMNDCDIRKIKSWINQGMPQ